MKYTNLYNVTFADMDTFAVCASSYVDASRWAAIFRPSTPVNNIKMAWQDVKMYSSSGETLEITVQQPTVDGSGVTPDTLTVQRGDTVYFTSKTPSGYEVANWTVNGVAVADSAADVLRLDTAQYPDETALTVAVTYQYTTEAPESPSNLVTNVTPTTLAASWKDADENFAKTFVTLQEKDTLNFIVSQYVTVGSIVVDDLIPSKTYVLTLTTIGVNGLTSVPVTEELTTLPAPGVKPDPVTNLAVSETDGAITATWTDPTTDFDYIIATLLRDDGSTSIVQSLEVAPALQSVTFDAVTAGDYVVRVTSNTELLNSDPVTERINVAD